MASHRATIRGKPRSRTGTKDGLRTPSKVAPEPVGAHQQAVVAALGSLALTSANMDDLMSEAAYRLAETLGVEFAELLELQPDGQSLLLRAGVGWRDGY